MRSWLFVFIMVALGAGLVGCDRATKTLAREKLQGAPPVSLVKDRLELRYVENPGVAFSLERVLDPEVVKRVLPVVRGLALLAILFYWWGRRREARWWEHVGFVTLVAGALGNALETWTRGVVVDFVHLRGWPVFNAADVQLCVGIGLVALAALATRRSSAAAPPPA